MRIQASPTRKKLACKLAGQQTQGIHECDCFHITRRKYGRGFQYLLPDQHKITERDLLKRFKTMVIPPMWQDVRISYCERSKIQAYGYDQRQRKQYIYHEQWEAQRQAEKFARLAQFARKLPEVRRQYSKDLERSTWDINKSCALALMLLDRTGIRIGNKAYHTENGTVGLTTLRRKHLEEQGDELIFQFTGKHGKQRHIEITDEQAAALVNESATKPGYPLLRYKEAGSWHDLLSDDVNEYLHSLTALSVSAKDFRTWTGTRLAMQFAIKAAQELETHPRRKFIPTLVKLVAIELGNTPSVCQKYYIHPEVLNSIEATYTKSGKVTDYSGQTDWLETSLTPAEQAALKLI